ncbi:MAG: epoxyqueuosine reductase [Candidatus Lokiarchaeota archaeon]|nr:epoxyqueuosine reductase [Candidatus Lokiarchaeota archaeon]
MNEEKDMLILTEKLKDYLKTLEIDIVGVADVNNELFVQAPEEHQPKNILEKAKSVIVFGIPMTRSIFKLKKHQLQLLHREYHSLYKNLDIISTKLAIYIESLGHYAIPIPSYNPTSYKNNIEPWGVISLKHASVAAGIGKIAKNGMMIHPRYGTLVRLAAVITTANLSPDPVLEEDICLDCNLCVEACPYGAFTNEGKFNKIICMPKTVKHGLFSLHYNDPMFRQKIELVTNTMFLEYSIGCTSCQEACPLNKKPLK